MQIDLTNTLVHKVYSNHNDIIHHCPQARSPLPWEGLGVGFTSLPLGGSGWVLGRLPGWISKNGEGTQTSELIIKLDFDFEFD